MEVGEVAVGEEVRLTCSRPHSHPVAATRTCRLKVQAGEGRRWRRVAWMGRRRHLALHRDVCPQGDGGEGGGELREQGGGLHLGQGGLEGARGWRSRRRRRRRALGVECQAGRTSVYMCLVLSSA